MATRSPKIAEDLFTELRRQIIGGKLAPGTRLPPERKLASAYGTNRNTLREAIRMLEQAHLVTVRHGQGVTVSDFRATGTIDLLEAFLVHGTDAAEKVRTVKDLLAARTRVLEYAMELTISRADEADIERLSSIADALVGFAESGDRERIADGYAEWLDALIDASHSLTARWIANPLLELNERLIDRFPGMWIMDDAFPAYVRTTREALVARDVERVVTATRAYYERIDEQILSVLGWVIQSGMAAWDPGPEDDGAEARRMRREQRVAASRRRRLSAELAAVTATEPEEA